MKKLFAGLLLIAFLLSACGTAPATATPVPLPTDSPTAAQTSTLAPTLPPTITPTASITPIPTIATFTPTFDVRTIVTVTPAKAAVCPIENPALKANFYVPSMPICFDTNTCVFSGTEKEILNFLNVGGAISSVIDRLKTADYGKYQEYAYQDVTGDKIPDLMFIDFSMFGTLHFFVCNNGKYELFSSEKDEADFFAAFRQTIIVQDLNLDNLPEILFLQGYGNNCCRVHTLEWNGNKFEDLSPTLNTISTEIMIQDVDRNGTKEILGTGDLFVPGAYSIMVPYRLKTYIHGWDGKSFPLVSVEFAPPEYRFQAIQDGDRYTFQKEYDKALLFYQDAIFNDKLDWWSAEKRNYLIALQDRSFNPSTPTPSVPDPTEYPRLAAYAYFRMVALHVYLGEMDAATVKYNTLQQKFPAGNAGHPYVEMATAFWDSYQSSANMTTACGAAIQYAAEHPEILVPLGSDYHGWQSRIYAPVDVCPFR